MKHIGDLEILKQLNCSNISLKSYQIRYAYAYLQDFKIYLEQIMECRELDIVVKAHDKYNSRDVIVHIIFNQDIEMKKEIEDEIQFLKKIGSEYLMKIFDCYYCEEFSYLMIIMEYSSNGNFLSYYKSQTDELKNEQIINIITNLSKGLQDIYNKSIINLNVNPQNLFIQENSQPKIYHLDFSKIHLNKSNHTIKNKHSIIKPSCLGNKGTKIKSIIYCLISIVDFLSCLKIEETLSLKLLNDLFFHSQSQEFEEEMKIIYQKMKMSIQTLKDHEIIYNQLLEHQFFPTNLRSQKNFEKYKEEKNGYWIFYNKQDNTYEGEWFDDCKNGKGVQNMLSGTYEGDFLDDQYSGQGTFYENNGNKYSGSWKNGKKNGQGIYFFDDGRYEGEFKNNCFQGQGTCFYKNGCRYEGEFKNGVCYGQGTYFFKGGSRYEGEWKNDLQDGKGTEYSKSGNRVEGEWVKGKLHGQITDFFTDGDKLECKYKKGKIYGLTTYYYQNGDRYEGEWSKGENGKGTLYYKNGNRYEGEFQNRDFHGQGTYFYKNGDRYEGQWQQNEKNGKGTQYYQNGSRYEGEFQNGDFHGQGTYFYQDGDRYREWQNNKKNRKGTQYFQSGDRYEGEFQNGDFHGLGTYFHKNGDKEFGRWSKGQFKSCCQIF